MTSWTGPSGAEDFDELTFEYEPEELGIDAQTAARIEEIKQLRPFVWLEYHDYVIVLEKRRQRIGEVAFLITAYHVDGPNRRENLRGKYNERIS